MPRGPGGASHRCLTKKQLAGMCEKLHPSLPGRTKKCSRTNCSKSFGPRLRLALACCSPSAAFPFVPTGCMRRHSGSAARLGVILPTDARTLEGTTEGGGGS